MAILVCLALKKIFFFFANDLKKKNPRLPELVSGSDVNEMFRLLSDPVVDSVVVGFDELPALRRARSLRRRPTLLNAMKLQEATFDCGGISFGRSL